MHHATVKNWVAQFKRGDFPTFFPLVGLRTYQHPDILVRCSGVVTVGRDVTVLLFSSTGVAAINSDV
jgi:hypothetical protein